jgi:hypothetical protein
VPTTPGGLPRLGSAPELEGQTATVQGQVVSDLARLSDRSSVPRLVRPSSFDPSARSDDESYLVALVGTKIDIDTLLRMSPLSEDDTLRLLARLITDGVIEIPAATR